jgi:hypothetical protein
MKFSQPLRIDYEKGVASFVTRRARNSQLVFANNMQLEARVLGALGKYLSKYNSTIYAFCIFGSHDHNLISFQPGTKSNFFRDFGARTAEAVKKYIPSFGGGSVFERRTMEHAVPQDSNGFLESIMYICLQPIEAGLCKNLSDYPGYNCFNNLVTGKPLEVEFFNGSEYLKAKRRNKKADPAKFIERYTINFARIPGYEQMSQQEYSAFLHGEFNTRRDAIIARLNKNGHKWLPPERLKRVKSTDSAKNPKKSTRGSTRPLVSCKCPERTKQFLEWYFDTATKHRAASKRYLAGDSSAIFPGGTHKPPGPFVPRA